MKQLIETFFCRTSALRSSQNSLQSSITSPPNSQRPSSAYYPQNQPQPNFGRPNLHQSIPNLKSPPSMQRLHQEDNSRISGSYPNVGGPPQPQYHGVGTYSNKSELNFHIKLNLQTAQQAQQQQQTYLKQTQPQNYHGSLGDEVARQQLNRSQYNSPYDNSNQSYPSPTHSSATNYGQANHYSVNNGGANGYAQQGEAQQQQMMYNSSVNTGTLSNGQKYDDRMESRVEQKGKSHTLIKCLLTV